VKRLSVAEHAPPHSGARSEQALPGEEIGTRSTH
jgi:hypothetical protein